MSEAVAAPQGAPVVTDQAQPTTPTQAPEAQPQAPTSYREHRANVVGGHAQQGYREMMQQTAEAAPAADVPDPAQPDNAAPPAEPEAATERPRDEQGRFVAADAATPETPAAEAAPEGDTPAATDEVPAGYVRIDLPEGHPLRERGRESALVPEADQDYHRWAVNNAVRARSLEQMRENAAQIEQRAVELHATLQAREAFVAELFNNPAVITQVQEIREYHGEDAAKRFVAGLMSEQAEGVQERVRTASQQYQQQQIDQQAHAYVENVLQQSAARYAEWGPQEIRESLAAFGSYIEARGVAEPSPEDFFRFADAAYIATPRVQESLRAQQAREREAQDAAARQAREAEEAARAQAERERLQAAATVQNTNPWGRIPVSANTGQVHAPQEGPRSYRDFKQSLRG